MKKIVLLLIASCVCFTSNAQVRKGNTANKAVENVIPAANSAMRSYDFDKAISFLEGKINREKSKKSNRQSTVQEEALLEIARKNKLMLAATEVVTFVDSIALPKDKVLKALKLSEESGTIDSYSNYFNLPDSNNCTVFVNQLQNRILYAAPNQNNRIRIYEKELIGTEWKAPEQLQGLVNNESEDVSYPFLMNDGITLYFAAQREEGLGGFDIYMTRYDVDNHSYLSAENVGMPFNSPANDYLMIIDEYNELGYFVTDRNQPADSVCLYTFIPNATRRIYQDQMLDDETLRNRARISSIAETWTDKTIVTAAKDRLNSIRNATAAKKQQRDFEFIVNDARTYYTLSDFRKPEAAAKAKIWVDICNTYNQQIAELESLRMKYAAANKQAKEQMAPQIRIIEKNAEKAYDEMKALEKEIRRIEI